MLAITQDNFDTEVLQSTTPVLVDFWASWCGPCRMIAPIIEQLTEEYEGKVKICKLDVDVAPKIAADYEVSSIPTLITFKNGEVARREVGARGKSDIEEMLDEL